MSLLISSCSLFQGEQVSKLDDPHHGGGDSKPVSPPTASVKKDHSDKRGKKVINSIHGQASYYKSGTGLSDLTANGEKFDDTLLTAAHRDLPFGTSVRVVNLKNKKSVEVRINDRGPFAPDRIIDVTHAAGKKIGMLDQGIVPVRIDILD